MFCYFIIAVLIAAIFTSTIFYPELKDATESGTVNTFTESPTLVLALAFACAMLIAPITYVILLVDGIRSQVRKGIESAINQD